MNKYLQKCDTLNEFISKKRKLIFQNFLLQKLLSSVMNGYDQFYLKSAKWVLCITMDISNQQTNKIISK